MDNLSSDTQFANLFDSIEQQEESGSRLVTLGKINYKHELRFGLTTTARLAAPRPSVVSLLTEMRHAVPLRNQKFNPFSASN